MNSSLKKRSTKTVALMLAGALMLPSFTAYAANGTYTTKNTDTFWKMSRQFNVPLSDLMAANPKIHPLNIYAGLKIIVPAKSKPTTPKQAAPKEPATQEAGQSVTTMAGQSLAFSKVIDIKASAYSASAEENGKWGAVDYFGNPLRLGTIAVDPKVIPFGTKVYITGYAFSGLPSGGMIATASDSGGAIKGNRIDIFVPGSREFVLKFGMQNVKVYVLK